MSQVFGEYEKVGDSSKLIKQVEDRRWLLTDDERSLKNGDTVLLNPIGASRLAHDSRYGKPHVPEDTKGTVVKAARIERWASPKIPGDGSRKAPKAVLEMGNKVIWTSSDDDISVGMQKKSTEPCSF